MGLGRERLPRPPRAQPQRCASNYNKPVTMIANERNVTVAGYQPLMNRGLSVPHRTSDLKALWNWC